jgi:hypothetical protein
MSDGMPMQAPDGEDSYTEEWLVEGLQGTRAAQRKMER